MSTRLWYPCILIDEVLPTGRETPEAWLDFFRLKNPEDLRDPDERSLGLRYKPGDTIDFKWVEFYGSISVSINRDGTTGTILRCPQTPDMFTGTADEPIEPRWMPFNSFYESDSEIYAETLEEFAGIYAECFQPGDEDTMDVEIEVAVWSEKLTFTINADCASLTPVTAAPQTTEAQA